MAAIHPIDERLAPTYIRLCYVNISSPDRRREWHQLLVPTLPDSANPVSQAVSRALRLWSDGSEQTDDTVNITINDGQQDHEFNVSLRVYATNRFLGTGAYIISTSSLYHDTVGVRYGDLEYALDDDDIDVAVYVNPPNIVPNDDEPCENGDNRSNCSISYLSARLDYIESELEKMSLLGHFNGIH